MREGERNRERRGHKERNKESESEKGERWSEYKIKEKNKMRKENK